MQVQAEPELRDSPQEIGRIYVRNSMGQMVPLLGVVDISFRAGPNVVSRFNGYASI